VRLPKRLLAAFAVTSVVFGACGSSASPQPASSSPGASSAAGASESPGSSPSAASVQHLTFRYGWTGAGEVAAIESVIADFNASHPDIQITGAGGKITADEISAQVSAGNAPDMIAFQNSRFIGGFAANGLIQELGPALQKAGIDTSQYAAGAIALNTYNGKLYGLPWLVDAYGLVWNKAEFRDVWLDPEKPPTTIAQLDEYAAKLTKYNTNGSLARAGFIPDDHGNNWGQLVAKLGCTLYDATTKKLTLNSPSCVKFWEWQKSYYDKYNLKGELTNLIASKGSEDEDLFYTGKIAMMVSGSWLTGAAYAPNFAPKLDYGAAPFPAIDPAQYSGGYVNGNGFAVPKGSKCLDCAVTFWAYLESKGPMVKIAIQNASVPTPVALQNDPTLNAIPNFGTFIKIANSPVAWSDPTIRDWAGISDALDSAWDTIKSGGQSPKQALDAIVNQFQPGIDANGP
jgi:multiple sugar transport system substrate-binding protein